MYPCKECADHFKEVLRYCFIIRLARFEKWIYYKHATVKFPLPVWIVKHRYISYQTDFVNILIGYIAEFILLCVLKVIMWYWLIRIRESVVIKQVVGYIVWLCFTASTVWSCCNQITCLTAWHMLIIYWINRYKTIYINNETPYEIKISLSN